MRFVLGLCALLLGVPAFAQEITDPEMVEEEIVEDPIEEEEVLGDEIIEEEVFGVLEAGKISRAERDHPAVHVRLGDGGRLQVKDGEEWKDASLQEFSTYLDRDKRVHDAIQRKVGGSGYEVLPGGGQASKLFVSIEVAPDTPWQHLQWLMTLAAEQKYFKLELSDGKRRMLAFLPTDRGINPTPQEPPAEIRVVIHLVARAEEEAKWGDKAVMRPTKVLYRFGDRQSEELKTVGEWIDAAKKAVAGAEGDVRLVGEIRAGHKVPFGRVLDVLEVYVDKGVPAMNFYGTQIPTAELRGAKTLPYPAANYYTRD